MKIITSVSTACYQTMLIVRARRRCTMAESSSQLLSCWCIWKCWYLEGVLWFTSKSCIFFTGLLSHHHSVSPRYTFHVLKNSVAPSPLEHARHLDRLDPSSRDQWIKEWRSFRGGGQAKRSRLSTPPFPSPDRSPSPVDIYPQFPTSSDITGDEITLNVLSENHQTHTRDTETRWAWSDLKQPEGHKQRWLFILKITGGCIPGFILKSERDTLVCGK